MTAFPSTQVHVGSNVQLKCLVSHLLNNMEITLIWIKYTGYIPIHVKTKKLNLTTMENSILIESIKMEDITNWACLVFNKDHLVASAPMALNYIGSETDITSNCHTATSATSYKTMLSNKTTGVVTFWTYYQCVL